jgi:transcriptional regulator with XRE-family HTH domain
MIIKKITRDHAITFAQKDSIVYAIKGSIVYAQKGSIVYAIKGSTTYAEPGSTIIEEDGAKVYAENNHNLLLLKKEYKIKIKLLIVKVLKIKGKSLIYLANELGRSQQWLNYRLNNEKHIRINLLFNICEILDITFENFAIQYFNKGTLQKMSVKNKLFLQKLKALYIQELKIIKVNKIINGSW